MTTTSRPAATLQRILVPIDFSDDSLHALQVANENFVHQDSALIIVNALEIAGAVSNKYGMRDKQIDTMIGAVQDRLQTLQAPHLGSWKEVRFIVEIAKPVDLILASAIEWKADLVVMGAHGKSALTQALFGGTTYSVSRKLGCSVMVLRK